MGVGASILQFPTTSHEQYPARHRGVVCLLDLMIDDACRSSRSRGMSHATMHVIRSLVSHNTVLRATVMESCLDHSLWLLFPFPCPNSNRASTCPCRKEKKECSAKDANATTWHVDLRKLTGGVNFSLDLTLFGKVAQDGSQYLAHEESTVVVDSGGTVDRQLCSPLFLLARRLTCLPCCLDSIRFYRPSFTVEATRRRKRAQHTDRPSD